MYSQNSEATVVVDNIHSIVAAAAVKFNLVQIENLVSLVKEVNNLFGYCHMLTAHYLY